MVIEPQFDLALSFSEGLAVVRIKGKFGFIDSLGKMAIEPQFDWALSFSEGLAAVKINGRGGRCRADGKLAEHFEMSDQVRTVS